MNVVKKPSSSAVLGVFCTLLLLTGCAMGPAGGFASTPPAVGESSYIPEIPTPMITPNTTPTAPSSQKHSATANESTSAAVDVDISGWKKFNTFGIQFSYPAGWLISPADCPTCKPDENSEHNPFQFWNMISDHGIISLEFAANTAMDTDGDSNTYKRTELERTVVPGPLAKPTLLVAEHQVITPADKGKSISKLQVFLIDAEAYAQRTENPELDYFIPVKEQWAMLHSRDDFVFDFGIDEKNVSLEQARELLATPEYATMRAIMLSTKIYK